MDPSNVEYSTSEEGFPTLKDKTQTKFKYNIIYEINCIQSIKNKENKTALAEHAFTNKHSFILKIQKL